jgi:hypothetical protein
MKHTRVARGALWTMILTILFFPALVAGQAAQPFRTGEPGAPAPAESLVRLPEFVPSTTTFGTSYVTVDATDFIPFYGGDYSHSGGGSLRWPTGGLSAFMTAQVDLPNGVTLTEVLFYVLDNNAATNALTFMFVSNPSINDLTFIGGGTTSGQSATVTAYPATFTPYVVDSTTQRLVLGVNTNVFDGSIAIAGVRVGYTGAPGQLIMFPAPDRFVDTRTGRGGKSSRFVDGESYDFTITGVAGLDGNLIPVGATAVLGYVTAASPTQNGQFKILPGGTATGIGRASVLFNGGFTTGSPFTIRLDSQGRIRGFHTSPGGTSDLVVDVVGYYR